MKTHICNKALIALSILLLTATHNIVAQNTASPVGGILMNNDIMLSSDFITLSNRMPNGTARSLGMGSAFTSLGGDISSMHINPAGIGMYRSNHISLSPMVSSKTSTTPGTSDWISNRNTKFTLGNAGIVLNLTEKNRGIGPVTTSIGIAMNRSADFNYKYSYSTMASYNPAESNQVVPSIADIYSFQLNHAEIYPDSGGVLDYTNPYFWPAQLGYNGYMISPVDGSDGSTYWTPDTIGANASIGQGINVESTGGINEYLFSYGINFANILYMGATLGVESVRYTRNITYREEYNYNDSDAVTSDGTAIASPLDFASMWQGIAIAGSGINFKIGAIIRPVEMLRIGVAYHTPTYYALTRAYKADITSQFSNTNDYNYDSSPFISDYGDDTWKFCSPQRLLAGGSLTLGQFAVLSADYERTWYNSINVLNVPDGCGVYPASYNTEMSEMLKASSTYRAGIELKPIPGIALRGGAGYTTSMIRDDSFFINSTTPTSSKYFSAGVGFLFPGGFTLDIAYQNYNQNYTEYKLFSVNYTDDSGYNTDISSNAFNTSIRNHNVVTTVGFKF